MRRLIVTVVPRASKNELVGVMSDGSLKVRLMAPPIEGAANEALCALLATVYGLKKRAVRVISGEKSRRKMVEIDD
jgi:uncharacterized protein (TIGR00251 family)